jgi:hypothetical protein
MATRAIRSLSRNSRVLWMRTTRPISSSAACIRSLRFLKAHGETRIHAVESVAEVLEPSGEFSKAMAKLESSVNIHGAMKQGFKNLYGYTSDQEGIRHPLLDDANATADETDALFMIGACSAFVSYVINKARLAGLI